MGIDLTTDKVLTALFRSFAVSVPSRSPRLPAWDLSLVLRSLLRAPYEPLRAASTRDVSLKTVFLLALASAHRVSELQGLSAEVRHSKGWTTMSFSLAPEHDRCISIADFLWATPGFCHVHWLRLSKCGRIELKLGGGTQWDTLCVFPENARYSARIIENV